MPKTEPFYECPSFDRCSANVCPLDPALVTWDALKPAVRGWIPSSLLDRVSCASTLDEDRFEALWRDVSSRRELVEKFVGAAGTEPPLSRETLAGEETCRATRRVRLRIAGSHADLLPLGGLLAAEIKHDRLRAVAKERWMARPEEERAAFLANRAALPHR